MIVTNNEALLNKCIEHCSNYDHNSFVSAVNEYNLETPENDNILIRSLSVNKGFDIFCHYCQILARDLIRNSKNIDHKCITSAMLHNCHYIIIRILESGHKLFSNDNLREYLNIFVNSSMDYYYNDNAYIIDLVLKQLDSPNEKYLFMDLAIENSRTDLIECLINHESMPSFESIKLLVQRSRNSAKFVRTLDILLKYKDINYRNYSELSPAINESQYPLHNYFSLGYYYTVRFILCYLNKSESEYIKEYLDKALRWLLSENRSIDDDICHVLGDIGSLLTGRGISVKSLCINDNKEYCCHYLGCIWKEYVKYIYELEEFLLPELVELIIGYYIECET